MTGWVIGCDRITGDFFSIFHNCYYHLNNDIPHEEDDEKDPKTNNSSTVSYFPMKMTHPH